MSQECIALTPTARRIVHTASYAFTLDYTNAFATRMRPVSVTRPQVLNVFANHERPTRIVEFIVDETATTDGNAKKLPLRFILYRTTQPTLPVLGSDYTVNPTTDATVAGIIRVTASDYKYVSDGVYRATLYPDTIRTNGGNAELYGGTGSAGSDLYVVALYDSGTSGGPYANSSATLNIKMVCEYESA